jgi:hypothetical protein
MIYIEDVFPSFGHNITHSLVRSYSLRPTRVILVFKEAHLFMEDFSWHLWHFSQGRFTTRVCTCFSS